MGRDVHKTVKSASRWDEASNSEQFARANPTAPRSAARAGFVQQPPCGGTVPAACSSSSKAELGVIARISSLVPGRSWRMRDAEDASEQCEGDAQSTRLKRTLAAARSVGVGSNQGLSPW
jgi:hypothetical protein